MTIDDQTQLSPSDLLTAAQQVLDSQPFSRLVGASITRYDTEQAVLAIEIHDQLRQQFGFVHGGVIAYAADNAITFAASVALGPAIVTSGLTIEYLRPASAGRLEARASVIGATGRRAACRCDLVNVTEDGAEILCATAVGSAMVLSTRK